MAGHQGITRDRSWHTDPVGWTVVRWTRVDHDLDGISFEDLDKERPGVTQVPSPKPGSYHGRINHVWFQLLGPGDRATTGLR